MSQKGVATGRKRAMGSGVVSASCGSAVLARLGLPPVCSSAAFACRESGKHGQLSDRSSPCNHFRSTIALTSGFCNDRWIARASFTGKAMAGSNSSSAMSAKQLPSRKDPSYFCGRPIFTTNHFHFATCNFGRSYVYDSLVIQRFTRERPCS